MAKFPLEVKGDYRGFGITYNEHSKQWILKDGDDDVEAYRNTELDKVKLYADKLLKKDFEPIKAFSGGRWGDEFAEVTMTSIDDEGYVWIKKGDGRREKTSKKYLCAFTDKNKEIIAQINKANSDIELLRENVNELTESMEVVK